MEFSTRCVRDPKLLGWLEFRHHLLRYFVSKHVRRQEAAQQKLVNEDRATVRAGTVKTTTRGSGPVTARVRGLFALPGRQVYTPKRMLPPTAHM